MRTRAQRHRPARSDPVGGHVQQLFPSRNQPRRLEVLQNAGFRVTVPQGHLCCGRPLYDFGMLDKAKQYLERIMTVLSKQIDAGIPVVVLEPSCASVFRDELAQSVSAGCARHEIAEPDVSSQRISRAPRSRIHAAATFREKCCCTGTAITNR